MWRVASCFLVVVLLLGWASRALADEPGPRWNPPRALRTADYVLVPALGATMLTTGLLAPGSTAPKWTGRSGFDDGARDLLRGGSRGQRAFAGTMSDVLWIGLTLYPAVVESFVLAGLVHKKPDLAFRLFMIYGEAGLSAGVITVLTQGLAYRGRPLADECARDGGYDPMCNSKQLSRSFIAGHAAAAFNSAGLTCVHSSKMPLYGLRAGSVAACAGTVTLAATTGLLRVIADKHWTTDVLAGSATGLATGLLVPLVFHYAGAEAAQRWTVSPVMTGDVRGFVAATPL